MRIRTRAVIAALLSAALVGGLPGTPLGGSRGVPAVGATTGTRDVVAATTGLRGSSRAAVIAVGASAVPPVRVPVKEPPHMKMTVLPASAVRAKVAQPMRITTGVRVNGPPMLRPSEVDNVLKAARRMPQSRMTAPASNITRGSAPAPTITRGSPASPPISRRLLTPAPVPQRGTGTRAPQSLNPSYSTMPPIDPPPTTAPTPSSAASGTGINPWWRYQEQNVPGGGRLMVNVGTGNLLFQDDDMTVPHKGIALAFRRTYNSQGSAVSIPNRYANWQSLYGNGWTNTFDAHLVSISATQLAIYDIDGARYDYAVPPGTNFVAGTTLPAMTAGQHATLTFDGTCGWFWTKKSGTIYYFYSLNPSLSCPALSGPVGGYSGRLHQIIGRNRNTSITFGYSWDNGDASSTGKISAISAQTESGLTTNLIFGDVGGRRLLQEILFPDYGPTKPDDYVSYQYDVQGNLIGTVRPPNSAVGTRPLQSYTYAALGSGFVLGAVGSPRLNASDGGGYIAFAYTGSDVASATVSGIAHVAVVNPVVPDGVSSGGLQSGYSTGLMQYLYEYYQTGVSTPTYRDTDGHFTNWVIDGAGRPTQTQECTATSGIWTCSGTLLSANESWDADNNLVTQTDARGNETDYAYDANGNTTTVGEPLTSTSQGTFKPTKLYDYDAFNNVVAYCDETETHAINADWTGTPSQSDSRCTSQAGAVPHWRATFSYPSIEPYGELQSMSTPLGYTRRFSYSLSQQAGNDFGLPTSVTGDAITQFDNSLLAPQENLWYDSSGNLACYSKGSGTWVLTYDAENRLTTVADPEDTGSGTSVCGKSWGGTLLRASTAYYPSGDALSRQSMTESAVGVQTTYGYDADGNATSETNHHGCSAAPCSGAATKKYYDGADRLVEVILPSDRTDYYGTTAWITRYLYDLTSGGTVTYYNSSFTAHGNLFKTQETFAGSRPSTIDLKGQAFDALDRLTAKYSIEPSANAAVRATTNVYDASPTTLGLLTSVTDPLRIVTNFDYDPAGRQASVTFTGDGGVTPDRRITYDPNGRPAAITSVMLGTQQTSYDLAGRLTEVDEFAGGTTALTSPAQIKYTYYANDLRKSLSLTSNALTADPLISYAYRNDGARAKLQVTKSGLNAAFAWTYDSAGRVLAQSDPLTNSVIPNPSTPVTPGTAYASTRYTYDSGGSVASVTLPVNANFAHIARDAEGSPTHYTETFPVVGGGWTLTADLNVTTRGEAQSLHLSYPNGYGGTTAGDAWGKMMLYGAMTDGEPPASVAFDERTGAPLAPDVTQFPDNCPGTVHNSSYTYDAKARRIAGEHVDYNPDTCNYYSTFSRSTYDAEDHVVFDTSDTAGSPGCTMRWNPLAHPIWMACPPPSLRSQATLHYDGEQLLFASDAHGALITLNAEALGQVAPDNTVIVNDRDYAGMTIMQHSSRGYTPWDGTATIARYKSPPTVGNYVQGSSSGVGPTGWFGDVNSIGEFNYIRPDGFNSAFGTVQGTRVSQPDGWTTPDAYAGDVHDPMSQKPFMWNRNNPYSYSDPDGYNPLLWKALEAVADFVASGNSKAAPDPHLIGQVVIGKMADLRAPGAIQPGEITLLAALPDQGSPDANWTMNKQVLQIMMSSALPIRDASVKFDGERRDNTGFLARERELLERAGWNYDPKTHLWTAPKALPGPQDAPAPAPAPRPQPL